MQISLPNSSCCRCWGLFSKRPFQLNVYVLLKKWSYFQLLLLERLQHCVGDSCCPPKLLVHCVATSLLPTATRQHEQKLQLAGSHCNVSRGCTRVLHGLGRLTAGSISMRESCSFRAEKWPWACWHYEEASSWSIQQRKLMDLKWVF